MWTYHLKTEHDFAVLSDILGDEDHLGDMDFKVAGTKEGVTALQMDIKVQGITAEIMESALEKAKNARLRWTQNEQSKIEEDRSQSIKQIHKTKFVNTAYSQQLAHVKRTSKTRTVRLRSKQKKYVCR